MARLGAAALLLAACYDPQLLPWDGAGEAADAGPSDGGATLDSASPCPLSSAGCQTFTCDGTPSCFQVCPPHMDFVEAHAACEAWGAANAEVGTLAVIGSIAENTCLFDELKTSSSTYWWHGYWIGLSQTPGTLVADENWSWVHPSGGAFRNWYTGDFALHSDPDEPNDSGTGEEDCAFMFPYEGMEGGWADARCQQNPDLTQTGYVCELHR